METQSTSVLIVGGGLAGLSAATFLAGRGVPTVLVERHPGSSPHPRAIGFTPRTLEIYRTVGVVVPQGHMGGAPRRAAVESLAGKWSTESAWGADEPKGFGPAAGPPDWLASTPCGGAGIAQDRLEPIVRERAVQLGADVRLNTKLISFMQNETGVTARLRKADGGEYVVRAAYMIAADGHASRIREALGIGRTGHGFIRSVRSILFRAPLDEYLEAGFVQFELDQPGLKGMLTTYHDGRWLLMTYDDQDRDAAAQRQALIKAIGRSDLEIEIITTGRWELSALIADRFASGRVFLAGDAAHTLPPSRGGYGANTGIEDAHNLAWKLTSVLAGVATPLLLDTYDAERRPVAWLRHDQIFARPDYAPISTVEERSVAIIDDGAMELGQLYRSSAVLGVGDDLRPAQLPAQWAGQPGVRAPHLWATRGGQKLSTLDFFGRGWVLLTEDDRWRSAARYVAERLRVDLRCLQIGEDVMLDDPTSFVTAYGLKAAGASLIRPDGYVAWRSLELPLDPAQALCDALAEVLSAAAKVTG